MNVQLDHIFVSCAVGAPEAAALTQLGFKEGSANTHHGQGTACRRFFFEDNYLELLWVHDVEAARGQPARNTGIWDRWMNRRKGASPFGIVLRPNPEAADMAPPFATRPYAPAYLPLGFSIDVALDTPMSEPAFFWMGFQRRHTEQQPADHALGRRITEVRIGAPPPGIRTAAARATQAMGLLTLTTSIDHILELELDGSAQGESADLRPVLPLLVRF